MAAANARGRHGPEAATPPRKLRFAGSHLALAHTSPTARTAARSQGNVSHKHHNTLDPRASLVRVPLGHERKRDARVARDQHCQRAKHHLLHEPLRRVVHHDERAAALLLRLAQQLVRGDLVELLLRRALRVWRPQAGVRQVLDRVPRQLQTDAQRQRYDCKA